MKFILGLTGQTGSGKSSTTSVAERAGFLVINCDAVAKSVTNNNQKALNALCDAFSNEILNLNGTLNRKKLAEMAFKDKSGTELLNKTILPFIVDEIKSIINRSDKNRIMLDAPTLFESGIDEICQKTIAVLADEKIRRKRIIERDNLTITEAENRLGAAKSDEFYIKKANAVIYNNGEVEDFLNRFGELLNQLLGGNNNG